MSYCGPHGIPHSHFLGGPLAWTTADRDKALAWQYQQAKVHAACGTDPDDWMPSKGGRRDAWEFIPQVCPGCAALEVAQEQMQSGDGHTDRGKYLVRRRKD